MRKVRDDRFTAFPQVVHDFYICITEMTESKSIVVLGSLNMDLVMVTPRIPAAGETMHGTSFESHPGGKGLNQAVACQRLLQNTGWKTYMIGRVGDDTFSGKLKSSLDNEGVDVSEVKSSIGKPSGVALILVFLILDSVPNCRGRAENRSE